MNTIVKELNYFRLLYLYCTTYFCAYIVYDFPHHSSEYTYQIINRPVIFLMTSNYVELLVCRCYISKLIVSYRKKNIVAIIPH